MLLFPRIIGLDSSVRFFLFDRKEKVGNACESVEQRKHGRAEQSRRRKCRKSDRGIEGRRPRRTAMVTPTFHLVRLSGAHSASTRRGVLVIGARKTRCPVHRDYPSLPCLLCCWLFRAGRVLLSTAIYGIEMAVSWDTIQGLLSPLIST